MKIYATAFLIFLSFTSAGMASQFAVSMDKGVFPSGGMVDFVLFSTSRDKVVAPVLPPELTCTLSVDGRKIPVVAKKMLSQKVSAAVDSAAGSAYSFQLPTLIEGDVVITFLGVGVPRVVIAAVNPQNMMNDRIVATEEAMYPTFDSISTLYQSYLRNTGAYEPTYFLVGTEPEQSKFQISFKYQFFDTGTLFAKRYSWVKGLHFAYTQTSFWDLNASSAPFADTSYKPEFFWQSRNYLKKGSGLLKGVFFQGGIQHESNGKAEEASRSSNYIYAKPIFMFYDDDSRYGMMLSAKVWNWIGNDEHTNPDLEKYRGYFELETKIGRAEDFVGGALFRWSEEGASVQLDFSYPINNIFYNVLDIYFFAQYVDMLGESLIDYDKRNQSLRLGLAITR